MVTCCGGFEEIKKYARLPFERPIRFDRETHSMSTEEWAVRLFHETPSGNISKKSAGVVFLKYCPFCGVKLEKEEDNSEERRE